MPGQPGNKGAPVQLILIDPYFLFNILLSINDIKVTLKFSFRGGKAYLDQRATRYFKHLYFIKLNTFFL